MFTRNDAWICLHDRPVLSVEPGRLLVTGGCGDIRLRERGNKGVRDIGHVRRTRYTVTSHSFSPKEVRVSLKAAGHPETATLVLTPEADGCLLRVDGLPWDQNRVAFHLGIPSGDVLHAGGGLLAEESRTLPVLHGTLHAWADARHPYPISGGYTESGLVMLANSGALVRLTPPMASGKMEQRPAMPSMLLKEIQMEIWDAKASLWLGVCPDQQAAAHLLYGKAMAQAALPDELPLMPVSVRGGTTALEKAGRDASVNKSEFPVLCLEDWQGMRRKLGTRVQECAWEADPYLYTRLPDTLDALRKSGIRTILSIEPCLDMNTELYREAAVRGYCLLNRRGRIWEDHRRESPAAWVDLTNPRAVEWMAGHLHEKLDACHADGWVTQLALPFPLDASAMRGDAVSMRNDWAAGWYRVVKAAMADRPGCLVLPAIPSPHA